MNTWFRTFRPRPAARLRLVCFPHAGGSASAYRDWPAALPESVELVAVQYPGRQDRYGEPLPAGVAELAAHIAAVLPDRLDRPTVLFGHSLGASVAYEVARRLHPRYPSPVSRVVLSARNAPSRQRTDATPLTDAQLRAHVRALAAPNGAGWTDDEEVWRLVLPALRNDSRIAGSYRPRPGPPLTCPITAIAGAGDRSVTVDDVAAWNAYTVGGFQLHVRPGGHFWYEESPAELAVLLSLLTEPLAEMSR